MELRDRVALVTGGAVRLGKALALSLAAEGVRLAVHYNSSSGPAEETVAEINALGGDAMTVQGDLSRPDQAPRGQRRTGDPQGIHRRRVG